MLPTDPVAWLRSLLETGIRTADDTLNETVIRLAVTGLSRAGKTVFIVSMLANLLAMGRRVDTLPALARRIGDGARLRSVTRAPSGSSTVPHFDLDAKLEALAGREPSWPDRTADLSRIALTLTLDRSHALGRLAGPRRVTLEVLDYPGEWLLDLPMLGQDYADWSRETMASLSHPLRAAEAAPFLTWLSGVRGSDPGDESVARRGYTLYREALHRLREHGLRWLQPGRALNPGPRGEAPVLFFFPLPDASDRALPGTLAALLADRHAAYLDDMRREAFRGRLDRFDRQIVLVDVLGALHAGEAAFDDTARAIGAIARALRRDGLLARLLGQAQPTHLGFAATKADHVPATMRPALASLLRDLLGDAAKGEGRSVHAVASLRATEDVRVMRDGRSVEAVSGIPLGAEKRRSFDPGHVPATRPGASYWAAPPFLFEGFRPPLIDLHARNGIPHIGLDTLLADVLGDALA
ncbi:YcjX family protein [Elioraea rosea]|uniref:YcjX family protein n=1 Tax=Elioraea rosea TaxID=2492390 RepID=UPI001EF45216|nr:YcjX family protein [Elioraea rosea]